MWSPFFFTIFTTCQGHFLALKIGSIFRSNECITGDAKILSNFLHVHMVSETARSFRVSFSSFTSSFPARCIYSPSDYVPESKMWGQARDSVNRGPLLNSWFSPFVFWENYKSILLQIISYEEIFLKLEKSRKTYLSTGNIYNNDKNKQQPEEDRSLRSPCVHPKLQPTCLFSTLETPFYNPVIVTLLPRFSQ